jgi:hypothetical protein
MTHNLYVGADADAVLSNPMRDTIAPAFSIGGRNDSRHARPRWRGKRPAPAAVADRVEGGQRVPPGRPELARCRSLLTSFRWRELDSNRRFRARAVSVLLPCPDRRLGHAGPDQELEGVPRDRPHVGPRTSSIWRCLFRRLRKYRDRPAGGFPALRSRTRPHAFTHYGSRPSGSDVRARSTRRGARVDSSRACVACLCA